MGKRVKDEAILGIADAFMTLLLLSVAAFILFKASLAPGVAADSATRGSMIEEIETLHAALERSTVPQTTFTKGDVVFHRKNTKVATLASEVQHFTRHGTGYDMRDVGKAIYSNAFLLGNGRWAFALEVAESDGSLPVCITSTSVRSTACDAPPVRFASEIRIQDPQDPRDPLKARLFAWRGAGR